MKEALHYLDIIEIHASNFHCDIDGGIDSPAATNQDVAIVVTHCSLPICLYS